MATGEDEPGELLLEFFQKFDLDTITIGVVCK